MNNINRSFGISFLVFALVIVLSPSVNAGFICKIDDVLEAITQSAIKKSGKIETGKIFRQKDRFETILKRNKDLREGLGKSTKILDDASMLQKLDLPPGSKLANDFLKMDQAGKNAVVELSDTIQSVLKNPDGIDLLKRLDKQGILVIHKFGPDVIEPFGKVLKADNIWDAAGAIPKTVRGLDPSQAKKLEDLLKNTDVIINIKKAGTFKNPDRVRIVYEVLKKYGKAGLENLWELTKKLSKIAYKHPKKTALGALVTAIWLNPDIVLTPTGRLKDKALELAHGLGEQIAEIIAGVPSQIMKGIQSGTTKTIKRHLPSIDAESILLKFIHGLLSTIIFLLIILIVLWIIPFTRFIPKSLWSSIKILFKKKRQPQSKGANNEQ